MRPAYTLRSLTALIFPWHRLKLLGKPAGTTASPAAFQGHWHSTINQCVQIHVPQKLFNSIYICSLYNNILPPTVHHCPGFPTFWKGEGCYHQGKNRMNRVSYRFFPWEMAVNDLPVLTLYTQRQLLAHPWVSLPAPLPPEVCATSSYFPLRKRQTNWLCQKDTQKLHSFHFRDLMASPIPFQTELELWHGTRMYLQTLKIILEPEATVFTAARKGREGTNPASLLFWGN